MKAAAWIGFALVSFVVFESAWFSNFHLKPDGIVALTLAMSCLRGPVFGALTGFAGGLLEDAASGASHGAFSFLGLLLGWGFGFLFKGLYPRNALLLFLSMVFGNFLYFFIFQIVALLLGSVSHLEVPPSFPIWLFFQGLLSTALFFVLKNWLFKRALQT